MSAERASAVRLVTLYPRLLGTYGDVGNVTVLARRAEARGLPVEVVRVDAGDPVPRDGDIYVLGGGEDVNQLAAARAIEEDGSLFRAVDAGAVVLGVCAGFQILGNPGLGIIDVTTTAMPARAVGHTVLRAGGTLAPVLTDPTIVGFENHRGMTVLGEGVEPLGAVEVGIGNGVPEHVDGAVSGRVFGTYLHGPVLALNPSLADHLLSLVVGPLDGLPAHDDTLVTEFRADRLARVRKAGPQGHL